MSSQALALWSLINVNKPLISANEADRQVVSLPGMAWHGMAWHGKHLNIIRELRYPKSLEVTFRFSG